MEGNTYYYANENGYVNYVTPSYEAYLTLDVSGEIAQLQKLKYEPNPYFDVKFYSTKELTNEITEVSNGSKCYLKITPLDGGEKLELTNVKCVYNLLGAELQSVTNLSSNIVICDGYYRVSFIDTYSSTKDGFRFILETSELVPIKIANDELTKNYSFEIKYKNEQGREVASTYGAPYGSTIKIYVDPIGSHTDYQAKLLKIVSNGQETYITKQIQQYYSPYYEWSVDSENVEVSVYSETSARELSICSTDHISVGIYEENESYELVEKASNLVGTNTFYLKFICKDDYEPRNIRFIYMFDGNPESDVPYYNKSLDAYVCSFYNFKNANNNVSNIFLTWEEYAPRVVNLSQSITSSLSIVTNVNGQWVNADKNSYCCSDTVIIKAELLDENYILDGIIVKADSGANVFVSVYEDNIFEFIMPNENVTVSARVNQKQYGDYAFVGKFIGGSLNIPQSSAKFTYKYCLTIDEAGTGTFGNNNYNFRNLVLETGSTKESGYSASLDYSTDNLNYTSKSGRYLYYENDVVVTRGVTMADPVDTIGSYSIMIKPKEETDSYTQYRYQVGTNFTSSTVGEKGYVAIEAYRDDQLYKNIFIDKTDGTNKYYCTEVSFVFKNGTTVSDKDTAIYDVFARGQLLGTVNCGTFQSV